MARSNAVLVANAPMRWTPQLTALATSAETLLAADGGANHLARIGLRPAAVIGDLDSIAGSTRRWLGEEVIVERPDQDRTDLDKALEYAFDDLGLGKLTVLAATGGRVDHDAGNLGLLARMALGERLIFEGDAHRLTATREEMRLESVPGETWSFWTYDSNTRVTIDGVCWPVDGATLDVGGRPSISNRAIAETIRVCPSGGSVLIYREFLNGDRETR
jgi:thiamine pyrophosphokinase